jgi:hypothetical protein
MRNSIKGHTDSEKRGRYIKLRRCACLQFNNFCGCNAVSIRRVLLWFLLRHSAQCYGTAVLQTPMHYEPIVLSPVSAAASGVQPVLIDPLKVDSHIACRAHVVPLPCRTAKGLECVFPI